MYICFYIGMQNHQVIGRENFIARAFVNSVHTNSNA